MTPAGWNGAQPPTFRPGRGPAAESLAEPGRAAVRAAADLVGFGADLVDRLPVLRPLPGLRGDPAAAGLGGVRGLPGGDDRDDRRAGRGQLQQRRPARRWAASSSRWPGCAAVHAAVLFRPSRGLSSLGASMPAEPAAAQPGSRGAGSRAGSNAGRTPGTWSRPTPAWPGTCKIGRPDLPREYDDGGLVDVNHVPAAVLAAPLGLSAAEVTTCCGARQARQVRQRRRAVRLHLSWRRTGWTSCAT
jgi:hypothetical protein